MANMSYCRFQNTNIDLRDCLEALEDGSELSTDEFIACKNMFRKFIDFCCDEGIIEDEDGELDDRLEEFFDGLNRK